jgi:hypothetical protein
MNDIGFVELYLRPIDWNYDDIPEGPPLHTVFRSLWDGKYHDHVVVNKTIQIVSGEVENMSKAGLWYFTNKQPKPSKTIKVEKGAFLQAVADFGKRVNGKKYQVLNFRTNCIAFRYFVMKKVRL